MKLTLPPPNGDIAFELTYKKVKNINLRVRRDGSVQVSAPRGVPREYIVNFVAQNAPRLRQMIQNDTRPQTKLCDGMQFTLFGAPYVLKIGEGAKSGDGVIAIKIPDRDAFAKQVKQVALPQFFALCQNLLPLFEGCCPALPNIKMRQMRSQWANCNVNKKALTFSYNLAFAPPAAIEYVAVHEFCHFVHQNHSAAFYAEVEKRLPDWKDRREMLKNTTFMLN